MRRAVLAILAVVAALVPACASSELAAPQLRTRMGPAAQRPVRRVVALPASCGALSSLVVDDPAPPGGQIGVQRTLCPAAAMTAIDIVIRSVLEFGGFQIIDSERVNAVTATRHEIVERGAFYTTRITEQHGARFEDATPFEQTAILRELGADAVLSTRSWIGAQVGGGGRRTVVVQVRLVAIRDGALVWARRCAIEVGGVMSTDQIAMERGARCAIEGTRAK